MKKRHWPFTLRTLILTVGFLFNSSQWAVAQDSSHHSGYVSDIAKERYQVVEEVFLPPLPSQSEILLMDRIFTEKMSREFSSEFRYRFGFTEFEQLEFTSNRFVAASESGRLVPVDEYIEEQERFGKFISKELTEYHVDRYLRGNPSTKSIYRAKEAISNIEVTAKNGYKFKMRYKLSSNRVTFRFVKPDQKFHNELSTTLNGSDTVIRLSYNLTKSLLVGTDCNINHEIYSLRGEKRLAPRFSTSIVAQSFQNDVGATPKQERVLLGLSWSD